MQQPSDSRRPRPLHVSRSFTRLPSPQSNPASPSRTRANTIQTTSGTVIPSIPEARNTTLSSEDQRKRKGDIFETVDEQDEHLEDEVDGSGTPDIHVPETFDELPIEIRSLSERFLKSLSAKVHATPLTIDAISELFQDFYVQAESHISTHIATLSSRLSREKSPAPSTSSKTSAKVKGRARANSNTDRGSPAEQSNGEDQQMLTASEITDRRKARRMLELKRTALEEAVERGVCEQVYDRIWRHRSTDDEERDAKLQSRTAALALVGIGLKELHVKIEAADNAVNEAPSGKEEAIFASLSPARDNLRQMDDEHYPLGKLRHLTAAHKSIVETLSQFFPSSSSADEILPTLIYTLITSPPETLNVISNLHFMQRFRASGKVDGEAAYCLVNLEAAISFLETVDLASLRADEMPEGPQKSSSQPSSRPETPTVDRLTPPMQPSVARSSTSGVSPVSAVSSDLDAGPSSAAKSLPLPATSTTALRPGQLSQQQRRLSSLIQAQAERIEAGRENILNSADQAFDTINATLENSFKFLFGRLKEQQSQVEGTESPIVVPKTLADVKDLIRPPPLDEDDVNSVSGRSSIMEPTDPSESPDNSDPLGAGKNDRLLDLVGGRRNTLRDRSVDSTKSGGSSKRVVFAEKSAPASERDKPAAGGGGVAAGGVVGDLMNSINPLKGFGVPSFGRFGRSASTTTTPAAITPQAEKSKQLGHIPEIMNPKTRKGSEGKAQDSDVDLNAREALAGLRKTKPPVKRFLEVKDAKELRIGEVEELLRDYKRLAECLREAISS